MHQAPSNFPIITRDETGPHSLSGQKTTMRLRNLDFTSRYNSFWGNSASSADRKVSKHLLHCLQREIIALGTAGRRPSSNFVQVLYFLLKLKVDLLSDEIKHLVWLSCLLTLLRSFLGEVSAPDNPWRRFGGTRGILRYELSAKEFRHTARLTAETKLLRRPVTSSILVTAYN